MENSAMGMLRSLLVMKGPEELLFNLLVVAALPAVGEELLFRGLVQRSVERWSGRSHLAVWITAVVFSAVHMQFEGFLPRLLLGAALGYLFLWTRNLWAPIVAHFVFNGAQVVAQYAAGDRIEALRAGEVQDPQWLAGAAGACVIGVAGYYLYKQNVGNSTENLS
jgi:membrane protease YdiL (CAAX protease family)